MALFTVETTRLTRKQDWETLVIEAWGKNGLRVRATQRSALSGNDWALLPKEPLPEGAIVIAVDGQTANLRNRMDLIEQHAAVFPQGSEVYAESLKASPSGTSNAVKDHETGFLAGAS